jgi:hypothetical protein
MRWLLILVMVAGCGGEDMRVHYPLALPTDPTGTLVLHMTQSASDVSVAVNGVLVVDNAHTQHIVIDGVPVGTAEIIMAANGADKEFKVWVGSDHATTVPLGVPDSSTGFLKTLAGTLITILVYSWLHH